MNFIVGFSGWLNLRVELFDRLMIDLFSAAKRRRNVLRLAVVILIRHKNLWAAVLPYTCCSFGYNIDGL
jgi:hypothetical protein